MSKHVIIGVLVLMSISLLGVVGLQLYWINNAIQVKQAEFDRSVNEALSRVVAKLETQEAASVVTNQIASLQQDSTVEINEVASAGARKAEATNATPKTHATASAPKPAAKQSQPSPAPRNTVTEVLGTQNRPATQVYGRGADAKDHLQLHISKADSARAKQALRQPSGSRTTIIPSANGQVTFYQRVAPSKPESLSVAHLRMGSVYQLRQALDSVNFIRLNNQPVRISVDSFRTVALKMDSLVQRNKYKREPQPFEIASINVRNDSVFIINKGDAKPLYVSRNPALSNSTAPEILKARTYAREFQHTRAVPERYLLRFNHPLRDSMHAQVRPLNLAKLPTKKAKTSDISKIEIKKDKLNDVVQKMVVEYAVKEEPLQKRLNLKTLPELLKTELENKGIRMDFGYWVVSGTSDTIAANNLQPLANHQLASYKASLFPNDIFEKQDHLGLYFPDSKSYALRSMWGMLALSGLFTLIIIATFGTTIRIIYRQKKLSEMKNDFINNMTHEFKTPIATISLATDAIGNPKIYEQPDKIKYYTGIIRQENKRMNAQVENVLQIALLEKNDFKLNFKPVDVHILIAKAIESIRLQVEERLGQITVNLSAIEHKLNSDEVHLFNVICNLLDNANKYSPSSPEIQLLTQNVEGGILIAVEDKGMGMSKETQLRVFDKFYRVPTGNLHNVKGFGLGLSYVKAIVQAHKGNVRLKSEPGKGSRFEIFLPIS